jgi:hypothetical protein
MTHDEIIGLAREAGIECVMLRPEDILLYRFAKLVAKKEREACWKIACEYTQKYTSMACLAAADAIRARG